MSAVPAASYLMDFARGGERVRPSAEDAARLEAARASGFENGKAAGVAALEARLEEQRASFARQLTAARQAWVAEEAHKLAQGLATGLGELEARLAETTARVLKPVLRTELRQQAIADLRADLELLLTSDAGISVSVAGPEDLLHALRDALSGAAYAVTYLPNDASDVRIAAGQTILETRLGAWAAKIEEAVR